MAIGQAGARQALPLPAGLRAEGAGDVGCAALRYTRRHMISTAQRGITIVQDDEQALLAAARQRDPDALARIHETYYRSLFGYIAYRVGDAVVAEDLTSEVFMRLLDAFQRGDGPRTALRGWLFRVASNVVNDYHRNQHRAHHVALDESLPMEGEEPLEALHRRLTHEALAQALAELTPDQQTVIALRYGSGLSIHEVAEVLGKSEAAIKMLQARALAALARKMTA